MRSDQKEFKRKAWNERVEAWRIKKLAEALKEFFEANKKAKECHYDKWQPEYEVKK